jgi:hypothetical protein
MQVGLRSWVVRCLPVGCGVFWSVAAGVLVCWLMFAAGAGAAVGDATTALGERCSNEASPGFRSYLPDCRGYEQVTPIFKGGTELRYDDISENGSRMLAESLGVFAASRSDTEGHGSEYELSWSPLGWGVAAISPPASGFPAQALLGASPELGETLWLARSPSESIAAANFYVREPNGAMTEIGPLLPPSATVGPAAGESEVFLYSKKLHFLAASDNFSHVLFDLFNGHESGLSWPGDTTDEGRALYEYSGRRLTHPELVGVNSEGHLISSCETYLGAPTEQELYNAVSADGASVFFTSKACGGAPAVNEIYARLGGFPIDTVPISEPTFSACEACQTGVATLEHPAVTEQPAEFAGASEDGHIVFFLTSQELFAGDAGENLYEYDFDNPEGQKIVHIPSGSGSPEVQGVARVSEDGSHVYFVAGGRLTKGPREGENGSCLTELTSAEKNEEEVAKVQEEKDEPVTEGARCRPKQGGDNLYVYERDASYPGGRVAFIATLCSGEDVSGALSNVSQCPSPLGDAEDWGRKDSRAVQVTPDGRFVVFASVADLTSGDRSKVPQIFEYDAASEELVRVSRGSINYEPQGDESADAHQSMIRVQNYASEDVSPAQRGTSLAISADGSTVVFESSAALTADSVLAANAAAESALGGSWNVYEYHSTVGGGGTISDGDVYLISDGVNRLPVGLAGLDASGDDIFFKTADQLVPQDSDTQYDFYDAGVDGGFPASSPPAGEEYESAPLVQQLATASGGGGASGSGGAEAAAGVPVPVKSRAVALRGGETPAEMRAQKLARALKACRAKTKPNRKACEAQARRRYGPPATAKAGRRAKGASNEAR